MTEGSRARRARHGPKPPTHSARTPSTSARSSFGKCSTYLPLGERRRRACPASRAAPCTDTRTDTGQAPPASRLVLGGRRASASGGDKNSSLRYDLAHEAATCCGLPLASKNSQPSTPKPKARAVARNANASASPGCAASTSKAGGASDRRRTRSRPKPRARSAHSSAKSGEFLSKNMLYWELLSYSRTLTSASRRSFPRTDSRTDTWEGCPGSGRCAGERTASARLLRTHKKRAFKEGGGI
ncbi:MAG: hypothetical protein J3K34DRAFT_422818 [Monoraphidium minutum]|nr:MAG: hypothetical protein J3K34DRAFT_422818 [Monoraphidium minutum]